MTTPTEAPAEIGWQVVDPDGNVIDSGSISYAELTSDVLEQLNQEN